MPSYGYDINPSSGIAALKQQLCQALVLTAEQQHRFKRIYLDSFDWRLLKKGYALQADQHDDHFQLQLFRLSDNELISQTLTTDLPHFATDLNHCRLAGLLAPILGLRALMPQLELNISQHRLQRLNKQNKTTAELRLESIKPTSTSQSQPIKQLWHIPTKGYDKENKRISQWLGKANAIQAMTEPFLPTLLSRLDIDSSYNSKASKLLHAESRSDSETKQLLEFFLAIMRRNEHGIIADLDTEFLHDFRIAVRRSRTLLSQMPGIMPLRSVNSFKNQLAKLGAVTTPLRDLDVMLLNFDDYRSLLPNKKRCDLDPAFDFIQQQRQLAYQQVCRYLQSKTYTGFCQRWQTLLQSPSPTNTPLTNAKRPLKQLADQRIWKNYKKVLKQGLAITSESPPDDLHSLRKSCKKLRYLLEFFNSLYPGKKIKQSITTLKQLQDNLGEYQDIHVHMDFFQQLHSDMQENEQLSTATAGAIDTLISALNIQQQECRQQFQGRFKQFSSSAHQQLFKQLFRP